MLLLLHTPSSLQLEICLQVCWSISLPRVREDPQTRLYVKEQSRLGGNSYPTPFQTGSTEKFWPSLQAGILHVKFGLVPPLTVQGSWQISCILPPQYLFLKGYETISWLLILVHNFTYNYCHINQTIISVVFKQICQK